MPPKYVIFECGYLLRLIGPLDMKKLSRGELFDLTETELREDECQKNKEKLQEEPTKSICGIIFPGSKWYPTDIYVPKDFTERKDFGCDLDRIESIVKTHAGTGAIVMSGISVEASYKMLQNARYCAEYGKERITSIKIGRVWFAEVIKLECESG